MNELAVDIGLERACAVLQVNRSGVYRDDACRRHLVRPVSMSAPRPPSITATLSPSWRDALYRQRTRNSGDCLRGSPEALQGHQATTAPAACRRLDQPT